MNRTKTNKTMTKRNKTKQQNNDLQNITRKTKDRPTITNNRLRFHISEGDSS